MRLIFILLAFFVCAAPVHGASELSKINAQIKQTEQQNKKLEQQVKTSDREISKTKKERHCRSFLIPCIVFAHTNQYNKDR